MKVLITSRDIKHRKRTGGIGHYYKALRSHLGSDVSYFTVGSRPDRGGRWDDFRRLAADYKRFWRVLSGDVDLVTLNPSLGAAGLLRDGVLLLIAKWKRKKTVVFFRGWSDKTAGAIDKYWMPLFSFVFGKADGMIVLSGEFKRKLRMWGFKGPIWIETTTVGEGLLNSSPSGGGKSKECNLLFLARIERDKGIYTAIGAYELLRQTNVSVRLTVVGEGSELRAVRRFVRKRRIPDVTFQGYLDGKRKTVALRNADIYLFPSSHGEGMPNSVLEAMAFGLPIVITPVGGLTEFFEDGKMGFWLNKPDPGHLAQILDKLIQEPELRRGIGSYNAEYARQHFVASKVAQRLRRIWEEVSLLPSEDQDGKSWLTEVQDLVNHGVSNQEGQS